MINKNTKTFTTKQNKELRKLLYRLPVVPSSAGIPESFILKYVGFEAVARKIWHYYRCRSKTQKISKAGIPIIELKKACTYFYIKINDQLLNILLNSKLSKRGSKSARNLRNEVIHSWMEKGCKEVCSREKELNRAFSEFMLAVKTVVGA